MPPMCLVVVGNNLGQIKAALQSANSRLGDIEVENTYESWGLDGALVQLSRTEAWHILMQEIAA